MKKINNLIKFVIFGAMVFGFVAVMPANAYIYQYPNQYQPNPSVTIYATPTSVSYNGTSTIYWSSTDASTCGANGGTNGWTGSKNTSGTFYTGPITQTTTFSITCNNSTSATSNSVTIYISNNYNGQVPVINLTAIQTNINMGDSTYIDWSPTNNPTSCYGNGGSNGWSGIHSTSAGNFYTGQLFNTTVYSMTCSNNVGSATETVTVNVNAANQYQYPYYYNNQPNQYLYNYNQSNQPYQYNYSQPVQPTIVLYTDQATIPFNGTGTIRWIATNATSCYANGGSADWVGSKNADSGSFNTGPLTSDKTYTMTCTNGFGSATDSQTITVRGQVVTINKIQDEPTTTSSVTYTTTDDSQNNPQLGANVFAAGFFPMDLFGWLVLIILVLLLILLIKYFMVTEPIVHVHKEVTTVTDHHPFGKKTTTTVTE